MSKKSKNVDKRCTLPSVVSSYDHLYAMNDKSKTTLVCEASYHGRYSLSSDMSPHKLDLIQLAVPHTHVIFPFIYSDKQTNICFLNTPFTYYLSLDCS